VRRVLVTGSRTWTNQILLQQELNLQLLHPDSADGITILNGMNPNGLDRLAHEWYLTYEDSKWVHEEQFPANWSLGKYAGHQRNQLMVDAGADVCLAFPRPGSSGTWDCARRAEAAGIFVTVFSDPADAKFVAIEVLKRVGTLQPAIENAVANELRLF
jgi:hypothetical protein